MQYPPPITFESAGPHRSGPPRARARAGAACVVCRRKKVRCDGRGGKPCSICAFENVECILSPKQPRRYGSPLQELALMAGWRLLARETDVSAGTRPNPRLHNMILHTQLATIMQTQTLGPCPKEHTCRQTTPQTKASATLSGRVSKRHSSVAISVR